MASSNFTRKITFERLKYIHKKLSSRIPIKSLKKYVPPEKAPATVATPTKSNPVQTKSKTSTPVQQNTKPVTKIVASPTPLTRPPSVISYQKLPNRNIRPQTSPLIRPLHQRNNRQPESETEMAKKNVEIQHLQPSMLPEFFKPTVNFSDTTYDNNAKKTAQYRHFEISKTHKSLTRPLKPPRLANPFPEPVKMMPSDTVSDREKAEQMLAEAKCVTGRR